MYLWDSNILRHFGEGHPTLSLHLARIPWKDIALPSVVVAEMLRGRAEFALKAQPSSAPFAHELLLNTQKLLDRFTIVVFDRHCAKSLEELLKKHRSKKRYADMMSPQWRLPAIIVSSRAITSILQTSFLHPNLQIGLITNRHKVFSIS